MGSGEFSFEMLPRLVGSNGAAPFTAGFVELLCSKHDQIGVVDNLPRRVWIVASVGVVLCIFNLLDESLEWLGRIVWGLEAGIVGFKVHRGDSSVGAIKVCEYRYGCHVGISGVSILEGTDVDVRYRSEKELL